MLRPLELFVVEHLALQADLRHQLGERDVDRVLRGGIVEHRGDDVGIVSGGQRGTSCSCLRRQRERLRLDQVAGRQEADVLLDRCRARSAGCPPRFRRWRGGAGQRGLRLRHVGAGDFTDPEAVVGRLQLLCQHLLVVDVQREQLLRLDDADIGVDDVGEAGLLLRDQGGALGHDLVLGAVDVGLRLAAGIERLGQRGLRGADVAFESGLGPETR